MKKLLTLALVALTAAAAQAVTWTGSTSTITADVSSLDSTTIASAKSGRISSTNVGYALATGNVYNCAAYTVGILFDDSAAGDIIRFYAATDSSALNMAFSTSGITGHTVTYAEGVDASTVASLITSGSNTLVASVTVTPRTNSTNVEATITYYLNGVLIGTTYRSGGYSVGAFQLGSAVQEVYYTASDVITTAGTATTDGIAAEYASQIAALAAAQTDVMITNLVPEPTCLALLALGVAGLALKRKVA